ncbi:uncharacterized protein N0V89_005373 [Didymosphaeria variabile]|uniref:Ankyrin n=1 Tax=Didymosphaeria variabile TaxID=1932322 RepID=A0A9W8XMR9_9PLEO|nr:uncharacterized protein N0V89_005373 [Didymosphaeria variabile]KAJ4353643.1 hypothetical protein N0V89_005373 [Didymosphaeria variabile]
MRKSHKLGSRSFLGSNQATERHPTELSSTGETIAGNISHEHNAISLFRAAATGNIALLERLRQSGADICSVGVDGSNALHAAARAANVQAVEYLLSLGVSSKEYNGKGRVPLHEAALGGNWKVVSVLMRNNCDSNGSISSPDILAPYIIQSEKVSAIGAFIQHFGKQVIDQGDRPLLLLAARKSPAIMSLLLSHENLKITQGGSWRTSALHIAAESGNVEVLRLLLTYPGTNINAQRLLRLRGESIYRATPLQVALIFGHEEMVRFLLAQKELKFDGSYPWPKEEIHLTMKFRQYRMGQILLQDHRVQHNDLISPLLREIAEGNEDKALDLIRRDISFLPAYQVDAWQNPFNWAIALGYSNLAKRLMESPVIDVNAGKGQNFLPTEIAAGNGDQTTMELLIGHPSVIMGGRPLYEAVKHNHLSMVELLLSCPKINVSTSAPLTEAVKQGNHEIIRMLLRYPRIDVNAKPADWDDTALSMAVRRGNLDIIRLLLDHPMIDVNATIIYSDRNSTALDIALRRDATTIIEILRSYGAKTVKELKQSLQ